MPVQTEDSGADRLLDVLAHPPETCEKRAVFVSTEKGKRQELKHHINFKV